MASKKSYSIDDILNEYSSGEDNDIQTAEEDASAEAGTPEEINDENISDEYTEPIIKDDDPESSSEDIILSDETEENTAGSDITEDTVNTESAEDISTEPESGITFTENESEGGLLSDESEDEEHKFRTQRLSFSYRSATRIQDRPNRIVRNPEDNIRYVRKENDTVKSTSDNLRIARKKKTSDTPETKSDISFLESNTRKPASSEFVSSVINKVTGIRHELFGSKSVTEKHQNIDLKSVPEVDYFSIDIDINEEPETSGDAEKPAGFFRKINRSFEKSAENNLDDYNAPGDASLILEDLYSLKGNLTAKFFIQLFAALASIYLSAAALYSVPIPEFISSTDSPQKYSFALFILSALVLFSSFPMITGGFRNLFRKKADCDSLAAVSITLCTIAAAISTESPDMISNGSVYIYTPVAITAFLVNTIGKHLIVNRAINNFDMLISSRSRHALVYVDDEARAEQLTKGVISDYPILAATRKTGFAKDFLKYTYSADIADKLCRKLVPASLILSVVLTLLSVIVCSSTMNTLSITYISSALSMFISVCTCFGIPVIVNLPLAEAAAEAEDNESIILGYQSIDDFYDTNALIVDAAQIFPDRSLRLCAIKMFSDTKIDDAIIAASSLVRKSGSIFTDMFSKIIDYNDSLLENVENFSYEDSLGLCGWIKNKRILFGNRQLMVNHNIEGVPPKSKEQDIVGKDRIPIYLSVSGNLAAIFIVKLKADAEVSDQLSEITSNGVSLIIKSIDSVITVTRTARLFEIPEDMVRIVSSEHREYCDRITEPVSEASASVICTDKLSSVANAVSNIKHIHHNALTGIVLQSTSAVLAIFFVIVFMFIGILNQITPLMLILYHTMWIFITMLIVKVKPR